MKITRERLSKKIEENKPIVCFRSPGADAIKVWHGGKVKALSSLSLLQEQSGFVFAPFHCNEKHPIWLFMDSVFDAMPLPASRDDVCEAPHNDISFHINKEVDAIYERNFKLFSNYLGWGIIDKLVLARKQRIKAFKTFSWLEAFEIACLRYVHSYVYLVILPTGETWLGATPEVLLKGQDECFQTVALAGTQKCRRNMDKLSWNEKNIQEQAYVTKYLCDTLQQMGLEGEVNGPFTVTAGSLAHLKTEISFHYPNTRSVGELIQALHPTPAVCGYPKDIAFQYITECESIDRAYYSGFLGCLNLEGSTELYVNLRCMMSPPKWNLQCYVGGGLIRSSQLEDEWIETERKLFTMKYAIIKMMRKQV